jgi:hypothetical protein
VVVVTTEQWEENEPVMALVETLVKRQPRWNVATVAHTAARLALLALALVLAARAIYYFAMVVPLIRWPFELHGGESTMVLESRLLNDHGLDGLRTLYGPQTDDRFVAGNYPPIYFLLWALKPGLPAYPTGRTLSLLAGIGAAMAGAVAAYAALPGDRRLRGGAALLGAAAFVCTVPAFQQISIAKPDMVALAFAACGLALFEAAPNRRGTIAAGVCFALALLTKQSIGFALAAAGFAALRRGPRALVTLVLAVAGTLVVVLGALWLIAGPSLFEHLIIYNTRAWRDDRFDSLNTKFLRLHWHLLVPAVAYALWGVFKRPRSALTYYPLLALGTLVAAGSEGGGRNYFIELCLAMGLGAALALGTVLAARPAISAPLGLAGLLLATAYTVQAYTVFVPGQYVPEPPLVRGGMMSEVLAVVDATPDPILSDDVGYLAMRHRPAVIDDNFLATIVREKGLWRNDGIIAAIEARTYSLVLTPRSPTEAELRRLWGDRMVDAILANYQQTGPYTFVPKAP